MITRVVATLQVITRLQHRYQARGAKLGAMEESITQEAQRSRMLELVRTLPNDTSWEQMWQEGISPWNLRGVTPAITHLVKENNLREGRYLVPGCGLGYDVVALASAKRHVVGLDISKTSLEKAQELASGNPNAEFVEFVNADFFTYVPPAAAAFDAIFDYTFFCALDPSLRPEWAKKTAELLAVDGELITLVYPLGEYEGGPPYAVSLQAYEEVLHPWGLTVSSCNDDIPSVEARKGREKLVRWIRLAAKA
ncbi:unnamed protein product [Sphagnum jensenii]|uniref:Thiol methyltransferase 2 n=1 Tax=Sphagnum jensenii TaxID=128206 RepID=A0ABP1AVA7_9BRYO